MANCVLTQTTEIFQLWNGMKLNEFVQYAYNISSEAAEKRFLIVGTHSNAGISLGTHKN